MHFFSLISTKNKSKNKINHTYKRHTSIPSGCPYHISHSFTVTYVTVWPRHVSLHQVQYLDIEITMRVVVISIKRYLNGWGIFYISRLQNNCLRRRDKWNLSLWEWMKWTSIDKKKFIIFWFLLARTFT